ncbi:sulfite exporter TauE/SafE family protein [Candidatus Omnitrophota bacterium]
MIVKALTLGFSTGIFCLGYCAPILAPLMLSRDKAGIRGSAASLGLFLAGRLTAYLLVGAAIGLAGRQTKELFILHNKIQPALLAVLGLAMIAYGVVESWSKAHFCAGLSKKYFSKGRHLFFIGFLAGINICPPFLLASTYALGLRTIGASIVFFFFFFLATTVFLLPLVFTGAFFRFENVRSAARMTSVVVGVWFMFIAARTLGLF